MMESIWDVIAALGTVVAAFSIIFAFALYRVQKRDEYLLEVKKSLQMINSDMEKLKSLLSDELICDLCLSLLYSEHTQYCFQSIYKICNNSFNSNKSEDEIKNDIKKALGMIVVPIQTALTNKYDDLISEIEHISVIFHPDYKGLFCFSKACTVMMGNIFLTTKGY